LQWKQTLFELIGLLLLLIAGTQASTIEHPGVLPKDADCSSCHANKTKGNFVHSAMALPCAVCHLTETQGDMTTLNLLMPKEKICFACHEKSAPLQRHSANAQCVECHDSHSSSRRALLRQQADVPRP
jgi:hypothetical protein